MNILHRLSPCVAGLLLCVSCADTYQYVAPDPVPLEPAPVIVPSFDAVSQIWEEMLPSSSYVDPVETLPTDEQDPDYDNFLEHQDFKRIVSIIWQGSDVFVDNPQADHGVSVTSDGGYVVVRNVESEHGADDARGKVTYHLSGMSDAGQFKVYSDKKFQIVLSQLTLSCPDGPAISIQHKKRCFITLADGTSSILTDGEVYATDAQPQTPDAKAEDQKGCLFAEGQLIFSGGGALSVIGRHQHGIASDEYVRIHPGCRLDVQAVKDGIHTKLQYHQSGGIVRSYALRDGLQSDTLGVRLTGGYLYLFGKRSVTTGGNGTIQAAPPAQICLVNW